MSKFVRYGLGVSLKFRGIFWGTLSQGLHLETLAMTLTDAKIRSLKPRDKQYKVFDYNGLYILVAKTGSKLWRFKYRLGGKEGLLAFGVYPAIGLQQARALRDEARANVANNINPSLLKREAASEELQGAQNTFAKVSREYVKKKIAEKRAATTISKIEWVLAMANADFGSMPIADISAATVLRCLKKKEKIGQYETAKRMRSITGAVFRYAIANGLTDTDPTFALKDALIAPTVSHRAAITDKAELGRLLNAIDRYGGQMTTRIALKLLILFATRPGELRFARWEEFDFEEDVWTIPAERMKMRKPHFVPLPELALELLNELRPLTGWGGLLFPSNASSQKPISENTFNQALRRMGFRADQVTAHGFRATFTTLANESKLWHPDAIERAMAHVEKNAVRRAYDRGQHWDERVKMADWWAKLLTEIRGI